MEFLRLSTLKNLNSRTVLVRADLNAPLGNDGVVDETEDWRIEKSIGTFKYLKDQGAKTIVIAHVGRDPKESLEPIAKRLNEMMPVSFVRETDSAVISGVIKNMQDGDIVMLENLRSDPREKANDPQFAEGLASMADVFVNEAFSVNHREHASTVGISRYVNSYAGLWLEQEIKNLSKVLSEPEKPFLFITGGAKFKTKLPLIEKFAQKADTVYVGGALANNFFKEIGFNYGKSLIDPDANIKHLLTMKAIKIPYDVVTDSNETKMANEIDDKDVVMDIGPESLETLKELVREAKTIVWNGPLGLYEKGFDAATKELLTEIANAEAFSVVGGGDTVKLIEEMGLQEKISFVSTGGGAMLEFLLKGTLPGIEALNAYHGKPIQPQGKLKIHQ